ncbi:glycerate kinase [Lachnospiraceae bacterium NSJ-143]|nr:glycerate kinase [Lachnospiraceae bacterium NSJ-143]
MKAVIAIDSFKGSISSVEAGNAVKNAFESVFDGKAVVFPVSDGGEGTVETVVNGLNGETVRLSVTGPLGTKIDSFYGIINNGGTAVIEMAAASGLTYVPDNMRNPMNTTTFGVGEIILDAVNRGVRDFVIGLGGSATNDGGLGMLSALGVKFKDSKAKTCGIFGRDLFYVDSVDMSCMPEAIKECTFRAACDVKNPLCGLNGASAVFGPQKGADKKMVDEMNKALCKYAQICEKTLEITCINAEGAGAAGGLGFALMAFLGAKLMPGIDLVLDMLCIEKEIKTADIVITGEGRLDFQTVMGKAPGGVAALAKKYNIPVIAFCGCIGEGAEKCNTAGIDAYFPIVRGAVSLEEAMDKNNAIENIYGTAVQVLRLVKCIKK